MKHNTIAKVGFRVVLATWSIASTVAAQDAADRDAEPGEAPAPAAPSEREPGGVPPAAALPTLAPASPAGTVDTSAASAPAEQTAQAPAEASAPAAPPGQPLAEAPQPGSEAGGPAGPSAGELPLAADDAAADHLLAEADAFEEEMEGSSVKLYGFADFNYRHAVMQNDSPWYLFVNRHPSFYVGNLNLYVDAEVARNWRLLSEVRYTYLPAGASVADTASGSQSRVSGSYQDYTDFAGRQRQVGGVMIQRAQLEYRAHDYLTVTAGQWLSPYGVWVVDHGSPVIIAVFPPFVIGSQLIPETQVGLLASGRLPLTDDLELAYALGLSNGRTDYTAFEDMDNNKAVTGRAALTYLGIGELSLGATVYRGQDTRGTEHSYGVTTGDGTETRSRFLVTSRYDEVTYATDLRWVYGPLHVQGEWLMHEIGYTEDGRPMTEGGLFLPDRRDWGAYGLVGYRTPWFGIMPYAKAERSPHPAAQAMGIASEYVILTGGINVRAIPQVVFKLEYDYGFFTDEDAMNYSKSNQQYINSQIACSF